MSSQGSLTRFAGDLASPDPQVRAEAARMIWERYSAQLLRLVHRNLDGRLRRRVDAEDIVQSMYQSFCLFQGRSERPLGSRDDVWRMLVHIAMCKVANAAHRHQAARRDYRREVDAAPIAADDSHLPDELLEHMDRSEPTPDEAVAVGDLLQGLPDGLRQIALWRLEGHSNEEIAALIGRSVRSVELKMQLIREKLYRQLDP